MRDQVEHAKVQGKELKKLQQLQQQKQEQSLQQNVFIATNFSEEIFFVTENLHLATKYIIRH